MNLILSLLEDVQDFADFACVARTARTSKAVTPDELLGSLAQQSEGPGFAVG